MQALRARRAAAQLCAAAPAPRRGFAAGEAAGRGEHVNQGLTAAGRAIGGGIIVAGVAVAVGLGVSLGDRLERGLIGAGAALGVSLGDRLERGLTGAGVALGDRVESGLKAGGASVESGTAKGAGTGTTPQRGKA